MAPNSAQTRTNTIAPWLNVLRNAKAVEFYKSAFGATEVYRHDGGDGIIARLSIGGAEFWLSEETSEEGNSTPGSPNGGSARMILTVADPDAVFAQARAAGATEVYPVGEQHGWRVGRLVDPFGHHWEIGRPSASQDGNPNQH
ncbi:Glyoxalase family protein [Acidisarcina polymorpha]|uniref:Glyoxalase family protein n=1 Tax=Acidisarcina polymorpha TaxID=2211140 RepID=A0A2Z5G1I3_9BACT|nr:VOC family protein [Acidisarcina polymorpha]AXC12505.1 Glyoxalase family protein [Acidisarcina polymorpha]